MKQYRHLRVVLASPGDVSREREEAARVVDELNRTVARSTELYLELHRWETDVYPGFHAEGPQAHIEEVLAIEEADMFVGLFWKRFGSPALGRNSGTEHEFWKAYAAWKERGSPYVAFFFKTAAFFPKNAAEAEQLNMVMQFKENFPQEGMYREFSKSATFSGMFREGLLEVMKKCGRDGRNLAIRQRVVRANVPLERAPTIAGRSVVQAQGIPIKAYNSGDRVRHQMFGDGVVVRQSTDQGTEEVLVAFPNVGVKRLAVEIAPMEHILEVGGQRELIRRGAPPEGGSDR